MGKVDSLVLMQQAVEETVDESFSLEAMKKEQFKNAYSSLVDTIDALTELKKKIDDKVKSAMSEEYLATGSNKVENEDFSITYIGAGVRETFDTKAFRAEYPDLYAQFVKTTVTSPTIRYNKKKKGE